MSGAGISYVLKHPNRFAGALLRDPVGLWDTVWDRLAQRREYSGRPPYVCEADPQWQSSLYPLLGATPQQGIKDFAALWADIVGAVRAGGIDVGPAAYSGWNDGDTALVRAIWRVIQATNPARVVETGVGHGFTSRIILEALRRKGNGKLWSIDRPPLDPETRSKVGIAVGGGFKDRWTLIEDSSRRALPGLLRRLGSIDLFIHDSLHTERNVTFELDHAWRALKTGGVAIIDDIDSNWGYDAFLKTHTGLRAIVCEAEPVRPDERRFNKKGLFAIVVKTA
ncbi:MAG: class I SAM-dependent methyltransferase [Proteobacteria bacterium]|nr:class I SAM-dependent methyltransferase [Pseudomonadota bacterium]